MPVHDYGKQWRASRQRLCPVTALHEGSQGIRATLPSVGHRPYDDSVSIVTRHGSGFNVALERTAPYIANAFVQHDEDRVRQRDRPGRAVRSACGFRRQEHVRLLGSTNSMDYLSGGPVFFNRRIEKLYSGSKRLPDRFTDYQVSQVVQRRVRLVENHQLRPVFLSQARQ